MAQPTPNAVTTPAGQTTLSTGISERRRCVTLLEVLIALALLAGLAALVLPSMLDRLDERAFEAAADTASEQLMMARAHAQATGEAVEVTYSPATGQVQARVYAPWSSEIDIDSGSIEPGTSPLLDPSSRSPRADVAPRERTPRAETAAASASSHRNGQDGTASGGLASSEGSDEQEGAIAEPWASRALGQGISIARRPSAFPFGSVSDASTETGDIRSASADWSNDGDNETLQDLARGQEVRLAVFMPDGSALVGDDVFLNDKSGRCGRISINPWSGLPLFERLADLAAKGALQSEDRDGAAAAAARDAEDAEVGSDAGAGAEAESPYEPSRDDDADISDGAVGRSSGGRWGDENDD